MSNIIEKLKNCKPCARRREYIKKKLLALKAKMSLDKKKKK